MRANNFQFSFIFVDIIKTKPIFFLFCTEQRRTAGTHSFEYVKIPGRVNIVLIDDGTTK